MNTFRIFMMLLLLSVIPAYALDYSVTPYDDSVLNGEDAMYVVTLVNDGNLTVDVSLYATNRGWDVRPDPLADWAVET